MSWTAVGAGGGNGWRWLGESLPHHLCRRSGGEVVLLINRLDYLLEPLEQAFRSYDRAREIDTPAQLVDILEHLVKAFEMLENDVTVFLQNGHGDEEVEVGGEEVGPEGLVQAEDVGEAELALEPDEQHAEEEEEVRAVQLLEVLVEFGVEELAEVVEGHEL